MSSAIGRSFAGLLTAHITAAGSVECAESEAVPNFVQLHGRAVPVVRGEGDLAVVDDPGRFQER